MTVTYAEFPYGYPFCEYVRWEFAPTGISDLVVYFVRRIYELLRPNGLTAFITTNSIKDGDIRKDGLERILSQGGAINMAVRGIKWPGRANLVVSLVSLHKGEWGGKRILDGRNVPVISAYFEDSADIGEPKSQSENVDSVSTGTYFLGDGFLLSHDEANNLISISSRNRDVLFPIINGQEINNDPALLPGRSIINFFDWPIEKAKEYVEPFKIIEERVKPEREKQSDKIAREKWWLFMRARIQAYKRIVTLPRCFASARTTKHLIISACPTNWLYSDALNFFTTDRWDIFAVIQSSLHEIWARKYSGALKQDLRYSPSKCFDTFPFPQGLWQSANAALATHGEEYHEHRRTLMKSLWLGLTDIYNLFHTRDLSPVEVARVSKRPLPEAESGYQGILELRRLHRELDIAIRDAYGWANLDLGHDFIEVETLPENDRVRYAISPAARKEILERLLAENHRRAAREESIKSEATQAKKTRVKKPKVSEKMNDMFEIHPVAVVEPFSQNDKGDVDLSLLTDHAWQRPGIDQVNEEVAMLAAILKAIRVPKPQSEIRLAALLAMRPRLLTPSLPKEEAEQWRRLVGSDAEALPPGVAQLQPQEDRAWGQAVQRLLALGRMLEDRSANTWAPGDGLDSYATEGAWPEGRAGMVLKVLNQRGSEQVIETLPETWRDWLNVRAA